MRAPQPSLQRLFGLAAVPTQRGAAWQALDAALARLDPDLATAAALQAAQLARLDALLASAPPGAGLVPLLDRLLGAGNPREAPAPAAGPGAAPPPGPPRPRSAVMPAGGPASLAKAPSGSLRAGHRSASASALPAVTGPPGMPWPSRPVALPAPAAALSSPPVGPAGQPVGPALAAASAAAGQAGRWPAAGPAVPAAPRWPDPGAARQHWQQRLSQAGLAAAWQSPVQGAWVADTARPNHPLAAPPAAGATAQAPKQQALQTSPSTARTHTAWPADHRSQRLAEALDPRPRAPAPPHPMPAPPGPPGSRPARPPQPLQGSRVGGFKGLAALGLPVAAPLRSVGPPADEAARSAGEALADRRWQAATAADPQQLIDQVEAALREQAARNGISLGGLEPV